MDSIPSLPGAMDRFGNRRFLGWVLLLLVLGGLPVIGCSRSAAVKPAPEDTKADSTKTTAKPDTPASRYQIDVEEDKGQLINRLGHLGFLGQVVQEAWVFRYSGGFIESRLETDFEGQPASAGPIPDDWPGVLRNDDLLQNADRPEGYRREGLLILAAMQPVLPINQALAPYHPHLGGLFTFGPAGPLHQLPLYGLEGVHRRRFRIFVTIDPPKGARGGRLNLWTEQELTLRAPFVPQDASKEEFHIQGGKDLSPDREVTLLDRQRGNSRIRFKARFLSDGEVRQFRAGGK